MLRQTENGPLIIFHPADNFSIHFSTETSTLGLFSQIAFEAPYGLRYTPAGYSWVEKGSETEGCQSLGPSLKTAPSPGRLSKVRLALPSRHYARRISYSQSKHPRRGRRSLPGCTLCWLRLPVPSLSGFRNHFENCVND